MNITALARNLKRAGYRRAAYNLHDWLNRNGVPSVRKEPAAHVRFRQARRGEIHNWVGVIVAEDAKHGNLICCEREVYSTRPSYRPPKAKVTVGVRLDPLTINALRLLHPGKKVSTVVRQLVEEYVQGLAPSGFPEEE